MSGSSHARVRPRIVRTSWRRLLCHSYQITGTGKSLLVAAPVPVAAVPQPPSATRASAPEAGGSVGVAGRRGLLCAVAMTAKKVTSEELKTWGRRVEDRREKLGVSIDWLCDEAGIMRARYWPKVLVQRGERFWEDELEKIAGLLYAPEGWPKEFVPDPERIEAIVKARSSATIQRAGEAAARGERPLDLPGCPHLKEAGAARWCAYCVSEMVRTAQERAEETCAREHSDVEAAIAAAEDNGVRLVIRELEALVEQMQQNAKRAKSTLRQAMDQKLSIYRKCLSAAWRVRQRDTRLGQAGAHGASLDAEAARAAVPASAAPAEDGVT
jgi:hypothetical protein